MTHNSENVSKDFSKFVTVDITSRINGVNSLIENMQARLEELQTIVHFARQEREKSNNLLDNIKNSEFELKTLFQRIDAVELLVDDVKNVLNTQEKNIEKMEEVYNEGQSSKVANIFTPLFVRKNVEKSADTTSLKDDFQTSDYFSETK